MVEWCILWLLQTNKQSLQIYKINSSLKLSWSASSVHVERVLFLFERKEKKETQIMI